MRKITVVDLFCSAHSALGGCGETSSVSNCCRLLAACNPGIHSSRQMGVLFVAKDTNLGGQELSFCRGTNNSLILSVPTKTIT